LITGVVGYSGFEGRIGTERQSFRTGFYRFRPDDLRFEFLRNTSNNTWGLGFNEEGSLFGSTANGNPSVYLPIPNRYYEQVRGWSSRVLGTIAANNKFDPITDKVRQVDYHGGFTAAAGHSLYTARTYPKDYWNRTAFVAEPTGHLLATFTVQPKGADFASRNAYNLLASDDEWSSPIMAEVGPDGCVWVIDWYNYIVQHNPTPPGYKNGKGNAYETDLRDKTHGRVYRLVPKGTKLPAAITLKDATPEKLVETLKNDNLFWRRHAQRLLVERGKRDVVDALVKLIDDPGMDEIGLNVGAIHALWTLEGIGAVKAGEPAALKAVDNALSHKSAGVRRNAVQVAPRQATTVKAILDRKLLDDADAQVRLSALLALAEMPSDRDAARAVAAVLQKGDILSDRWLSEALTAAAAKHDHYFLEAVASEHPVKETKGLDIVRIVAEHYARGGSDKAGALVKGLDKASLPVAEIILEGLQKGWPKGKQPEAVAGLDDAMTKLLVKLPTTSKGALIRIALEWKVAGFEQQIATISAALDKTLLDEKAPEKTRLEAARQLIDLDPSSAKLAEKLLDLATPRSSPTLVSGILEALASSKSPTLAPTLIERLATFGPQARQQALRVLLSRPESTRQFLDGVEKGAVAFNDLQLEQKQALAAHPDKQIAARARKMLEKGGSLPSADRQKVLDELLPLVKKTGDAIVGKAVFKKHCGICHMHGGEGVKIGPDLTGMAVHTREHLLTDILDPSRSVEGNYRLYVVSTTDGKVLSGLLASETKTTVELFDSQGKKLVLQRDQIEQLTASTKSLMPEGFEKQLKQEELVDLLEFLTQRGKFVPLSLDKVASVVSTQGMFFTKESTIERMVLKDWSPKVVKGVPFQLVDPEGDKRPNMVMLYGPNGTVAPTMPKSVKLTCNMPARAIHLLSGVSGWGHVPGAKEGGVAMIVRLHYADGQSEDHPLLDGVHFADYIRKVDVPKSEYAFPMRGQQMRYLSVSPLRNEPLAAIELVKGSHPSAPLVMAVTVETK
jgi:putative heme-binding domain-containing protein